MRPLIPILIGAVLLIHVATRVLIEKQANHGKSIKEEIFDSNSIRDFSSKDIGGRVYRFSANARLIKHFTFGYPNLLADYLWLRFIQAADLLVVDVKNKGWLYNMLDTIVTLDPRFRNAYSLGGVWLSAIRRDTEGATELLEKGAKQFPWDWKIHLDLLYHHVWETRDHVRAGEIARHAAMLPEAPPFVGRLVGTLLAREKNFNEAITYLATMMKNADSELLKKVYQERLYMVIVERDTTQLQEAIRKHFSKEWPSSWESLVQKRIISSVPKDPIGDAYIIDTHQKKVLSKTIEVTSGLATEEARGTMDKK